MADRAGIERSPTFTAGFNLARQLRNPQIRAVLRALEWTSGQHIVIALDGEPVVDVITRIVFHETDGRALIAVTDGSASRPESYRFMVAEVAKVPADAPGGLDLGPSASIGMLYDALHPSGTYVPSEWVRALQFERVPELA